MLIHKYLFFALLLNGFSAQTISAETLEDFQGIYKCSSVTISKPVASSIGKFYPNLKISVLLLSKNTASFEWTAGEKNYKAKITDFKIMDEHNIVYEKVTKVKKEIAPLGHLVEAVRFSLKGKRRHLILKINRPKWWLAATKCKNVIK